MFEVEPLPADNPLWGLDNVFLSSHNADVTDHFQRDSLRLFVDNMQRFTAGEELLNVADKSAGY